MTARFTRVRPAGRGAARRVIVLVGAVILALAMLTGNASAAPALPKTADAAGIAATLQAPAIHQHKTVRACAAPKAGHFACNAIRQTDTVQPEAFQAAAVSPDATPSGYSPANLRSAYKLTSSGTAVTVAIVDAYDDPNAESDLATYRTQYGLPACTTANGCFKKVNQTGAASPLPTADQGWAGEISLDVQMVSAICPNCHILLVEASAASDSALFAAVDTAYNSGAKFISNSYGGSESAGDTSSETHFNHPGVAITASTGDDGYAVEYPASSKYVTAVGGTSLTTSSNARGWTETAWSGAGSGCSLYEAEPAAQGTVTTGCSKRADADVSAVADPNTGVAVYQTYGASGWTVYGGTSVAAPIIAGVYALAGTPGASDMASAYPYSHASSLFDVTSGNNGSCSPTVLCTAGTGWDGPTGLGTPNGTAAFTAGATTTTVTVNNPGSKTANVGTAFSLTLTASGGTSAYTWSATGLPAGLMIGSSTGTISGTPTTAGTYSVTAKAVSGSTSGTATFTITVAAASSCASRQLLGNPGFETGSASPWTSTSGVVNPNGSGESAHSGTYYAWLDGYGTTHTDTLTQSVTIPTGCTNTTLSFWLEIDTAETTTTTAYDKLTVKIGSTVLATYSNLNHGAYSQKSFNVGSFAGQTVTVAYSGVEDSSLQTSFVIDDTALTTS